MLPTSEVSSIAAAPLIVAAFMASSGVIFILIHASETTMFILPEGAVPGLKSDAKASFAFALIIFLACGKGMPRKKAHPGSMVPIVSELAKTEIDASSISSR